MVVKQGYTQTDIGIFPEDWHIYRYADIGQVIDGDRGHHYPSKDELKNDGFCLFLNAGNVTRFGFRFDHCEFISRTKNNALSKGKLARNDIVLTTRGTLGNFAVYLDDIKFEHIRINSGMVILRNRSESNSIRFQYEMLRSHVLRHQIERISFGSAQPQLTVGGINDLLIPLPRTLAEQETIAGALSDADAWIESLEQLIAKKRQIKQGAMQELLTGKCRLPGFSGQWETKTIAELCTLVRNGLVYSPDLCGPCRITRIETISDGRIDFKRTGTFRYSSCFADYRMMQGDILFSHINSVEHIGKSAFYDGVGELFHGMNLLLLRVSGASNAKFLHQLLCLTITRRKLRLLAKQAVSQASINTAELKAFELAVPRRDEQTAIATVLSDMDTEIESLESKLAKAREIKQGMMQELLTGRIRLIEN
jgi:type I restriction enzyme S subunit